jgi:hypothetical protein
MDTRLAYIDVTCVEFNSMDKGSEGNNIDMSIKGEG